MSLTPHTWPARARGWIYGLAIAVLLYLCLAPTEDLPDISLWDKLEHGSAWTVLAGLGLALWPARPRAIVIFSLVLGAVVEVLQAVMPLGRDGDWRDWVADALGVAVALLGWAIVRRLAGGPRLRA